MVVSNLNQEAVSTQRSIGAALSARSGQGMLQNAETHYDELIANVIESAIDIGRQIVAKIDDCTSAQSHRRPQESKASSAVSMCTIVVSIFKDIPAVSLSRPSDLHNPHILQSSLEEAITSTSNMMKLSESCVLICQHGCQNHSLIHCTWIDDWLQVETLPWHILHLSPLWSSATIFFRQHFIQVWYSRERSAKDN